MGKGDRKSKRGKIIMGSYGKNRRKKRTPLYVPPVEKKKPVKKEKPVAEDVKVKSEEVAEVPVKVEAKKTEEKKEAKKKAPAKKATTKTTTAKTTAAKKTTAKKTAEKKSTKTTKEEEKPSKKGDN